MAKTDKTTDTASSTSDLLKSMQTSGLQSMPGFGTNWLETMALVGSEMMDFVTARAKEDVQTQQDLLNAKGLTEIQSVQAQFFQKAMSDYTTEVSKLMELSTAIPSKEKAHALPV